MKRALPKMLAGLLLALAQPALAELSAVGIGGFTTSHSAEVAAAPDAAWQALVDDVSLWWNGDHSWSGDAGNLYIDATAGGCFCERLPEGGWVEHLRITYLAPGREMRLRGSLGPLMQMGIPGTMIWQVEPAEPGESGSRITFTYIVHGHLENGFDGIAPAVDGVIGEQLDRLVTHLASD